jgi:hypothetical protein
MPTSKPAPKRQPAAKPSTRPPRARKPATPPPLKLSKRNGRPAYVATDQAAAWVSELVGAGIVQQRICALLGISLKTLRKHFKDAIRVGHARIDALSILTLLNAMRGGGEAAVIAAKWWTQARMGWSERRAVDNGKAENAPVPVTIEVVG